MGKRPNCRSCRHCSPPRGADLGWCQLRQLSIHPDLVGDLWCHHWTASPPRLPTVGTGGQEALDGQKALTSHQLTLSGFPNDLSTP
ncbi:MAG: hypothetical protein ACK40D_15295 [Cyanobacteriota bacterium]|jgi:hypothetical protein